MATSATGLSLEGPFSSFEDLLAAQKEYESKTFTQLNVKNSFKVERYKKRYPDSQLACSRNPSLRYQSFALQCKHFGTYNSAGEGKRPNTSTHKTDCKMHFCFKAAPDGQSLICVSKEEEHNHPVSENIYKTLPRQRRLVGEAREHVAKLINLKASKVLKQQDLAETEDKHVTLKDLHNIQGERKSQKSTDVQDLVDEMKKNPGSTVDVWYDDSGTLQAIYYQDQKMMDMFAAYPSLLCIDGTYKLNNLDIPLYILMVVDGNGEAEIVSAWFPINEDIQTLTLLMEKFKEHNPALSKIKCVMTDKCPVERSVIQQCLPQAKLLICLFHVLQIFNREVTCAKMNITESQRQAALGVLQKLAYAKSEGAITSLYRELQELNLPKVSSYIDLHWWDIRDQWIIGLMDRVCPFYSVRIG